MSELQRCVAELVDWLAPLLPPAVAERLRALDLVGSPQTEVVNLRALRDQLGGRLT
jgi:hypothetical protein